MKATALKRSLLYALAALTAALSSQPAFGLSMLLHSPDIFFPKGYNTNRAQQVESVLHSNKYKYLDGLVSYWEPEFSTTLVYGGDALALTAFLAALNEIPGIDVRLTFSSDLSKETGSALRAGSWWVRYSHTMPNTLTIRINLAAAALGGEKFELRLPKPGS